MPIKIKIVEGEDTGDAFRAAAENISKLGKLALKAATALEELAQAEKEKQASERHGDH